MYRNDLWKISLALVAIAGAISSHLLKLPTSLLPYAGEIEFVCGAIVIGTTVYINKPNGEQK